MEITKKIVLLGHFGVGKTSLVRKFVDNEFNPEYMVTIGLQVKKKDVIIGNNIVSLIIWDIEGNTSLEKTRKSYLLGSSGFIYVFDLSRPETFKNIAQEIAFLQKDFPNKPIFIVGNKTDLVDVTYLDTYFKKETINLPVFTSAKTGENVEGLFVNLSKKLLENES